MDLARQARDEIKRAIDDHHGGVYAVAAAAGVHYTQIYAFLRGGVLKQENAGRLRAVVASVDAAVWANAFAPPTPQEPAAEAQA